jgi:hypothetical protein
MLRLLIGTGLALMVVGFGAAGWQYWASLPAAPVTQDALAQPADAALAQGGWLVSPTGGLIPRDDVRAYLAQDRLVPGRSVTVTHTAPLTALLAEGQTLPAQPYLQVFADIRAPRMAEGLCEVLLASVAQDCAVHSARVVPDSVDPVRGTARFRIELAFRLKPEADPLPDLGARVFQSEILAIGDDPTAVTVPEEATEAAEDDAAPAEVANPLDAASVTDALAALAATVVQACSAADDRQACRILSLSLDWAADAPAFGQGRVGWLEPLPEGMIPAPSLDPAPEAPQG